MSGRAGRRGLDEKGIVILMIDEKMSPNVILWISIFDELSKVINKLFIIQIGRNLVKGAADTLNSAFHLTYNMVLNLLRVEEINPEYMLERSFFQFQQYAAIPNLVESNYTIFNLIFIQLNLFYLYIRCKEEGERAKKVFCAPRRRNKFLLRHPSTISRP